MFVLITLFSFFTVLAQEQTTSTIEIRPEIQVVVPADGTLIKNHEEQKSNDLKSFACQLGTAFIVHQSLNNNYLIALFLTYAINTKLASYFNTKTEFWWPFLIGLTIPSLTQKKLTTFTFYWNGKEFTLSQYP